MRQRFKVGSRVTVTPDALENYGTVHKGKKFTVSGVSTFYCPADVHYSAGHSKNCSGHPGFDDVGSALYDLEGLEYSLYDWELQ